MELRAAREADLAGIAAVRRSNGPAHHDSGVNPHYCRFLIAHGHLWVAVDDGAVVGFAGAIDVDDARLLADLYVHRQAHGRGVGTTLLAEVLRDAAATFTFASSDPAAHAIYARCGMLPTWALVTMHGAASRLASSPLAARDIGAAQAAAFEEAHGRSSVLRYWAERSGTRVLGAFAETALVGTAIVHLEGATMHVEHLVADDAFASAVLAATSAATRADTIEAYVPVVRPLHGKLLAAGFEAVDTSMFMTSRPGVVADRLQVVHPGLC